MPVLIKLTGCAPAPALTWALLRVQVPALTMREPFESKILACVGEPGYHHP